MAKKGSRYICSNCGAESLTWSGKCHACGEWNTLEEQLAPEQTSAPVGNKLVGETLAKAIKTDTKRIKVDIGDCDTVFGGGIVPASIVLIAGEPGIGKSTILMQISNAVAHKRKVLYVSGEESAHQVGLRAQRLKAGSKNLEIATTNSADNVAATVATGQYDLVVVDSIQTIACDQLRSSPGTAS